MVEDIGQKKEIWTEEWEKHSVESEIHMWDFFGGRPWILKYAPRNGKVIEAGCGLGRYVFLMSKLGINIEGLDFSSATINHLNNWRENNGINANFTVGDVKELPYKDYSLSGYLSFGVIEHFIEGPQKALKEAYRVLKPGGIAIITTPSDSWFYYYNKIRRTLRNTIKYIIRKNVKTPEFFQYWYSLRKLKIFVENVGFKVTRLGNADLLYTFHEFFRLYGNTIKNRNRLFVFSQFLEKTILRKWGAQNIIIAVKPAEQMHCFFCDERTVNIDFLKKFDVPICNNHENDPNTIYYEKNQKYPSFKGKYTVNPDILKPEKRICSITQKEYMTDDLFEDFGLNINVHPEVLRNPKYNYKILNQNLKPVWRGR
jgi:ubiquinone/menaquinone biosynthesis C-methylase UbiE